jgi:hypothetical protein
MINFKSENQKKYFIILLKNLVIANPNSGSFIFENRFLAVSNP